MSEGRCVLARSNSSGRIKRSFDNARGGGHNKTENQRPNVPVIPNRFGFFGFKQTPQSPHVSFQQHTYPLFSLLLSSLLICQWDILTGGHVEPQGNLAKFFIRAQTKTGKKLDQILVTFFPLLSKRAIFE